MVINRFASFFPQYLHPSPIGTLIRLNASRASPARPALVPRLFLRFLPHVHSIKRLSRTAYLSTKMHFEWARGEAELSRPSFFKTGSFPGCNVSSALVLDETRLIAVPGLSPPSPTKPTRLPPRHATRAGREPQARSHALAVSLTKRGARSHHRVVNTPKEDSTRDFCARRAPNTTFYTPSNELPHPTRLRLLARCQTVTDFESNHWHQRIASGNGASLSFSTHPKAEEAEPRDSVALGPSRGTGVAELASPERPGDCSPLDSSPSNHASHTPISRTRQAPTTAPAPNTHATQCKLHQTPSPSRTLQELIETHPSSIWLFTPKSLFTIQCCRSPFPLAPCPAGQQVRLPDQSVVFESAGKTQPETRIRWNLDGSLKGRLDERTLGRKQSQFGMQNDRGWGHGG
ncbi:hypothetical protein NMY22_g17608 [Coprinellus aureogranulatus]|nr:hypothetical protein NMY22_g17608 [Coprinellus aureogranulatus]